MSTSPKKYPNIIQTGRLASIDGLRGFACLMVVLVHLNRGGFAWPQVAFGNVQLSLTKNLLAYGYLGVDIFFVLSAFCLSYPIFRKPEQPPDWRIYFQRRAIRIWPPYYVAFMLFLFLAVVLHTRGIQPYAQMHTFDVPSLKQVIYGLLLIEVQLSSSFWTLCVEARWYLLLPMLLFLNRRLGLATLFLLSCVVSVCFMRFLASGPSPWAGRIAVVCSALPLYLPTFIAGITVATLAAAKHHNRFQSFIIRNARYGLLISIVLVFCFTATDERNDYARLIPGTLLAFFALLSAIFDKKISHLLSREFIVAIGTASYSIYLIHDPIIRLVCAGTQSLGWSQPVLFLFYEVFLGPLTVAIGFGVFYLVEKPLLRKRDKKPFTDTSAMPAVSAAAK